MSDLADMARAALDRPAATPAIRFDARWHDWGWLRATAHAIDAALTAGNVGEADPVGFVARNRPEHAAALLALLAAGRHVVMIYAYQSPEAMARQLAQLDLPVVVAAAQDWTAAMLTVARATGSAGVALGREGADACLVAGTAVDRTRPRPVAPPERGLALLTSGTTGSPKHIVISHDRVHRAFIRESSLGPRSGMPALHYYPFGNISGIYAYLPIVAADLPIVMLEKFALADWLDYVAEFRPASLAIPPTMFRALLDADIEPDRLASLEWIGTGAATLDPSIRREFEQRYGIPVLQAYGATEFGGVVSTMRPEDRALPGDPKADAVGRPIFGASFRIVDPVTGDALPPGTEGRLEVLAPRMGQAWVATTDLAMLDADGFLYHRGRLDAAIMRGGFKIVPDTVAAALAEHPAIAAAAVVGIPDARSGAVPAAAYVVRAGADDPGAAGLEAHLRGRLPATHLPTRYRSVDALPCTHSLKIDLTATRALFAPASAAEETG